MRGEKQSRVNVTCLINVETMIPAEHPIRAIKRLLGEVLAQMDAHFDQIYAANGRPSIPPERLLLAKVLMALYSIRSERQFCERLQYDLLFRWFLDLNPDETTFDHSTFSQNQRRLLRHQVADLFFAEVVWLAKNRGWVSDQHFSVDATLIEAWASLKSFKPKQDDLEVAELLAKAEQADATPLQDGLTVPAEVARRQARQAKLAQARAAIEARAYARAMAEHATRTPDEPGPPPPAPSAPREQINFTDPDSAIMKAGSGQHFEQSYNAQAGLEVDSRLIIAARVTRAPTDKEQLPPTFRAIAAPIQSVAAVLIDSGFVSEAAVRAIEQEAHGQPTGVRVLAAGGLIRHGRTVADLEKHPDPPVPPPVATFTARLAHRTATRAGRQRYKLRQQTIEPVFGVIKEVLGFRRFSLRGLAKVSLEWTLVTLAYNLKRLHTLGANLQAA